MECNRQQIIDVCNDYIHIRADRNVMILYLTDYPGSLERLAEECDVSVSTVKRIINRNAFIYKYLPGDELKLT